MTDKKRLDLTEIRVVTNLNLQRTGQYDKQEEIRPNRDESGNKLKPPEDRSI